MPTCTLTITSVEERGFQRWQADTFYGPIGFSFANDIIVDSNGNLQLSSVGGLSGDTEPTNWGTSPGDTTTDGGITWTMVIPEDQDLNPITYPTDLRLGKTLILTWTSTDAVSATINGANVPPNGTATFTPTLDQFTGSGYPPPLHYSYGDLILGYIFGAPQYELVVTASDESTATAKVTFALISPVRTTPIYSFAPVLSAVASEFGDAAIESPITPDLSDWEPNTNVTQGTQRLDSNGFGEVALNDGTTGPMPPTWSSVGEDTTETTGLEWENTGQQYPGSVTQRGFGPLWDGEQSTIIYDFGSLVIPSLVTDLVTIAPSTLYTEGQLCCFDLQDESHDYAGIPLFRVVQGGTTGTFDPASLIYTNVIIKGQVFIDGFLTGGTEIIWQFVGFLQISINWTGSTVDAPDDYPVGNVSTGGDSESFLTPIFDGTVTSSGPLIYEDINSFLNNLSDWDPGFYPFQTASVPPIGVPEDCPTWNEDGLGTGIINSNCAAGFTVNVDGTWAEFDMPIDVLSLIPPPPPGTIIIVKSTNPPGSTEEFTFNPSWGASFELSDGQSNSISIIPGTYSITEDIVDGWTTETSQDTSAIELASGQTITIIFYNTQAPSLTGISLVADFQEGIDHRKIKWDQWTYLDNVRLLSAASGDNTYVVNILDSGKIIRLDETQKQDYVDGETVSPIDHYAITAGFDDQEDWINFLYAMVLRVVGAGLLHVSVMDIDDVFVTNPINQVDCPPVILQTLPGKNIQISPQFESEKYYIKFEAQVQINGTPQDIAAYFIISKIDLYSSALYSERPQ